jgi:hypothetical protein
LWFGFTFFRVPDLHHQESGKPKRLVITFAGDPGKDGWPDLPIALKRAVHSLLW